MNKIYENNLMGNIYKMASGEISKEKYRSKQTYKINLTNT